MITDYDETIKTIDTIGGDHTTKADSENCGGATAAAPPSHRSQGARGAAARPHRELSPKFDKLITDNDKGDDITHELNFDSELSIAND